MLNLKEIVGQVAEAVRETEKFIIREAESFDISLTLTKGLHDFVSYVDKGSEKMLVDRLSVILQEAGFIAEEGTASRRGTRYCWVIDPLDGTTNFIHGIRPYAISVALTENGEPVAGVVCNVGCNELFRAWKNGGAWLNGKQIKVSGASTLAQSLVATGFPYSDFSRLDKYMDCLRHFCKTTHGIRRQGSASIDLAYVACGRYEAFYEYDLKVWDVAAGIILVREAGGTVSDFSGSESGIDGSEIAAACKNVFPEFLKNVSNFME